MTDKPRAYKHNGKITVLAFNEVYEWPVQEAVSLANAILQANKNGQSDCADFDFPYKFRCHPIDHTYLTVDEMRKKHGSKHFRVMLGKDILKEVMSHPDFEKAKNGLRFAGDVYEDEVIKGTLAEDIIVTYKPNYGHRDITVVDESGHFVATSRNNKGRTQ